MARPRQCRRIGNCPNSSYFKPKGIPLSKSGEVLLAVDEFEAIRLADLEGLYHDQAAEKMQVSRPTFGRIIGTARRKVAEALVHGKALKIEGGVYEMADNRKFRCDSCQFTWELPLKTGIPQICPFCQKKNIQRAEKKEIEI
jgi:uncharacterized protein